VIRRTSAQRRPAPMCVRDPQKRSISVTRHSENRERLYEETGGGIHPAAQFVPGGRQFENGVERFLVHLHDVQQAAARFKPGPAELVRVGEARLAAAQDVIEQRGVINGK